MADWPPTFLATLQEAHRLILVDNRGMGRSNGPMDRYSMAAGVVASSGLLDFLGMESRTRLRPFHGRHDRPAPCLGVSAAIAQPNLGVHSTRRPRQPDLVAPTPKVLAQFGSTAFERPSARMLRDYWPIVYTPAFIKQERDLLESMLAPSWPSRNRRWKPIKARWLR